MASKDESSAGSKSQVKTLFQMSVEHVRKSVGDTNVVELWRFAEATGDEELKKLAHEYLGKKDDKLPEVPGMVESFQTPQLGFR